MGYLHHRGRARSRRAGTRGRTGRCHTSRRRAGGGRTRGSRHRHRRTVRITGRTTCRTSTGDVDAVGRTLRAHRADRSTGRTRLRQAAGFTQLRGHLTFSAQARRRHTSCRSRRTGTHHRRRSRRHCRRRQRRTIGSDHRRAVGGHDVAMLVDPADVLGAHRVAIGVDDRIAVGVDQITVGIDLADVTDGHGVALGIEHRLTIGVDDVAVGIDLGTDEALAGRSRRTIGRGVTGPGAITRALTSGGLIGTGGSIATAETTTGNRCHGGHAQTASHALAQTAGVAAGAGGNIGTDEAVDQTIDGLVDGLEEGRAELHRHDRDDEQQHTTEQGHATGDELRRTQHADLGDRVGTRGSGTDCRGVGDRVGHARA